MHTRISHNLLFAGPLALLAAAICLIPAAAQVRDREQLVPAQFAQVNDVNGNYWDVQSDGRINNGYNDCFDGAMYLIVNGTQFQSSSNLMRANPQEYVLSHTMNGIRVTRRILIDVKRGAARYLEVFENTQNSKVQLNVQLRTLLGGTCQQVVDSTGSPFSGALGKKVSGICAIHPSYRPCVYFATHDPRSKTKPIISVQSNRTFTFSYSLVINPRQTLSLLHVIAQRRSLPATGVPAVAQQFFDRKPIDAEIPSQLARTVANFRFGPIDFFDAGPLLQTVMDVSDHFDVARDQGDYLVLGEGARFKGRLAGGDFIVKTQFGETKMPLDEVAMLVGGNGIGRRMQLYLRNGEVMQGEVATAGDFVFHGDRGLDVRVQPAALDLLLMRTNKQLDGKADEDVRILIATQDGSRIGASHPESTTLHLATPWGPLDVRLTDVGRLWLEDAPVPTFRLLLSDRSLLPAIPAAAGFLVETPRWGKVKLEFFNINSITNLAAANENDDDEDDPREMPAPFCRLTGESRVAGTVDLRLLPLRTASGVSQIAVSEVASLSQDENSEDPGSVILMLDNGDRMAGVLALRWIPFRIQKHVLRIPLGQIEEVRLKNEQSQ